MDSIIERDEVVHAETPTGSLRVIGWRHDDGEAIAQIEFRDNGKTLRRTVSISEVSSLVRGLQRWLAALRYAARPND